MTANWHLKIGKRELRKDLLSVAKNEAPTSPRLAHPKPLHLSKELLNKMQVGEKRRQKKTNLFLSKTIWTDIQKAEQIFFLNKRNILCIEF